MKKKIARFLTTFVLVLCVCFGLTACKKDSGADSGTDSGTTPSAKVTSIAVELANDSYELVDGTITKTYGEAYNLTSSDFKIVATFDNETTQTLPLKTGTADGYTFTSSVKTTGENSDMNGDLVQVGDYTLTFGYGDLTSKTVNYKVTKAIFDTSVLTWTSEMKYNGTLQSPVVTNASDYNGVVDISYGANVQKAVSATGEHYTATATLTLVDTRNYVTLTTEQETISHDWTMQKGDNPTWPAIQFKSYTYNNTTHTAELVLSESDRAKFSHTIATIDGNGASKHQAKDVGTYPVKLTLTYKGVGDSEEAKTLDKNSYNTVSFTTEDYSWTISPYTIVTSGVSLKVKDSDAYSTPFTYDATEKEVEFDLSSLDSYLTSKTNSTILDKTTSGDFKKTNAGTYTATITFTVNEDYSNNYTVSNATVTKEWKINPFTINTSNLSLKIKDTDIDHFNISNATAYTDSSFTYDGSEKEVVVDTSSLKNLGYTMYYYYPNNIESELQTRKLVTTTSGTFKATNVGTYTAKISFTFYDNTEENRLNYVISNPTVTLTWKINKADLRVIAKAGQSFVYGSFAAGNVEFASSSKGYDGDNSIGFAEHESDENVTLLYNSIKNNVTFEVRANDHATTAYPGKLNVGRYALYPIIPAGFTFDNYNVVSGGSTSMTITQKELTGNIAAKAIEFGGTFDYSLSDVTFTNFVSGDTKDNSNITGVTFKYRLSTSTSEDDWSDTKPTAVGTYSVKLEATATNYTFNVIIGSLTINKANVELSSENISWNINNDNTIVPTYNETDGKWSATFEKTESAITYSLVIGSKYGDIFDITYKDENGEPLESITAAGKYTIKATVALKTDTSVTDLYNEFSAVTFILEITINQNYFGTRTVSGSEGEPEKTISVVVTTTEEDVESGAEQPSEENLTFNEFANKTDFKEGDTVKFTLAGDPAATSSSEEGEGYSASPTSQVVLYAATRTFARYIVLYNGEEVGYDSTERCYIIYIVEFTGQDESLKGLKIIRVYSVTQEEGDPTEVNETIFTKTNISVQTKRDDNDQGGNPSVDFEIPVSFKVGNKTFYTDGSVSTEQFYKLSETQETLTFTFDDEWVNRNLYLVFGGQTYIEINATTLTIDMTAYLDSGVTLDFALYNSEQDHYYPKQLRNANIYPWSVVELIKISYKNGDESGTFNHSGNALDTGNRSNLQAFDGVTGITVTFEPGYTNYTYKITTFDHETVLYDSSDNASTLDLTKLNCYRYNQIWFIIYDADGKEVGSKGFDFTLDSGSEIPDNNVEVCAEITSVEKWKYPSVKADGNGNTTFNLTCSTENLTIYTFNDKGAYSFVLKDADGEEVFSEIAEEDNGELQGIASFDYRFLEAGTYTLTMTAIDSTTTRTFTIVVTGEYVPTLDVSFDTDSDGEDKTLHCEIVDLNDFTLTEDSDFRMGIDYVNLTYSLDAYVGENHGFKITSKNGKKYVTLNSYETIYKDLYDLEKNKLTCPAELEVLTNLNSIEYVSFKLKITRSIWVVVNVYFCEPSSDLEITLTGDEGKDDKKLTCNITDMEAMTTEGDFEVTMVDADGDDIACMVACVGDIETLGTKVTTTDGVSYISFTGLSSGLFLAMADETFSGPLGASGNLLLHEVDSIKFVRLYGMMGEEQMVAIIICFCDKDDLPEGFIEANVMPSTDPDGGSGDGSGDGSGTQEDSTVNIMKVTMATTNDEYIILVYNNNDNGYGVEEHNNVESGEASVETDTGVIAFSFDYVVDSSKYSELMNAETYTLNGLEFLNQYASETWTLKTETEGEDTTISSENSNLSLKVTKNYKYDQTNGNPCLGFELESSSGMKIVCNITFITSSGSVVE